MHKRINILLLVLVLLAGSVAPVLAQRSWVEFDNDLRVFGRAVIDGTTKMVGAVTTVGAVTVGTSLSTGTTLSAGTALAVGTDATISDDLYTVGDVAASPQSTVTVTSGGTVTPSSAYVPLTAAGAVGTSSIAGCTAGDTYAKVVTLVNTSSNTITFTDTATLKLSGNAALGQWDALVLRCDVGSGNWVSLGLTNN